MDPPMGGTSQSQGGGGSVSPSTADQIAASIGDSAARSITGIAPDRERSGENAKVRSIEKGRSPASDGTNPLSAVASAAGTGAEVGGLLVYTLLALTLLVVGVAWTRFRRSGD